VLEVVGSPSALRAAYDLVRPGGTISSVGCHTGGCFAGSAGSEQVAGAAVFCRSPPAAAALHFLIVTGLKQPQMGQHACCPPADATFPFSPVDGYNKNLTYRSGRCSAR
jgi:threonine dehydrogenase-like Zn-dependent dehydrogenase